MSVKVRAFQIYYDEHTHALLDPRFEALDNSVNERADWYEYWPIRKYLLGNQLDEDAFYGFLSPQFFEKTQLTGGEVHDFIRTAGDADVISFSPFPCHSACFLNVFEQGECFSPGLQQAAVSFFRRIEPGVDVSAIVTDSRNTVFSNYFFAKRKFWARWRAILEEMFGQTEVETAPLHSLLTNPLGYQTPNKTTTVHAKIFVMERVASFILATSGSFKVKSFPPFEMPLSRQFREARIPELICLDALKIAFAETRNPTYLTLYRERQRKTLREIASRDRT